MKRPLFLILIASVIGAIAVLSFKLVRGNAEKEAIAERIKTLPDFRFETVQKLDFSPTDISNEQPLVIIHFLPDCHYCQGEAKELAAHAEYFQKAHILMVSAAEMKQIQDFGAYYGMANLPACTLARDAKHTFGQTFGTVSVPTTFVYSAVKNGRRSLLKHFTGETSAEAIRKVLKENTL